MCITCGCGTDDVHIEGEQPHHEHVHADGTRHSHAHPVEHGLAHSHSHSHAPGISPLRMVQIEQDILSKNNGYAEQNREQLARRGVFALNLVSSPGSGKTALLCKTITRAGRADRGSDRGRPANQPGR